jgi:hypothetical protein
MPVARMKSVLPLATLLVVFAAYPARAGAQDPAAPALDRLGPTSVVRATLPDGRTITGTYSAVGDGRLGISANAGGTDTLRLAQLRALSVRGRHTKTGAILGGTVGLAAGLFLGYMIGGVCDAAECDRGKPFLVTVPLFAGGGTLLGAAIGSALPKWTRVFP